MGAPSATDGAAWEAVASPARASTSWRARWAGVEFSVSVPQRRSSARILSAASANSAAVGGASRSKSSTWSCNIFGSRRRRNFKIPPRPTHRYRAR